MESQINLAADLRTRGCAVCNRVIGLDLLGLDQRIHAIDLAIKTAAEELAR